MKTGKRRKGSGVFLLLAVMLFALSLNAQAATKAKAGVYKKTYSVSGSFANARIKPADALIVTKVFGKKITFVLEHYGVNGSPLYQTNTITASVRKNKVSKFKWEDNWGNSGVGSLKFSNKSVKITMKTKKQSSFNRWLWGGTDTLRYQRKATAKEKKYYSRLNY